MFSHAPSQGKASLLQSCVRWGVCTGHATWQFMIRAASLFARRNRRAPEKNTHGRLDLPARVNVDVTPGGSQKDVRTGDVTGLPQRLLVPNAKSENEHRHQ